MGYIYRIRNNINGKCYIGKTINRVRTRWVDHINGYHPLSLIHKAIEKYGLENFTFEVVEEPSNDILNKRETFWIKHENSVSPNGYNLTEGGDGSRGYLHTDETKRKMSEQRKGKPWTERQRDVLSKARVGNNNAGKSVGIYENGELIKVFPSGRDACRETGIRVHAISKTCVGKQKCGGGFVWKFVEEV